MYEKRQISADKLQFSDLNYETMLDFLSWLETERGCGVATRNQRLSALSSFSNYAQNRDFEAATVFRSNVNKLPTKKSARKPRAIFTLEEVSILLSLPQGSRDIERRDRALLSVMYASGARAQEICDLTVKDVRISDDVSTVKLTGKGGKCRYVRIPKPCAALLGQYIRSQGISENGGRHVFSSQAHEHMTTSCIREIYWKYVRLARESHPGLFRDKSYTPHSMRHSVATHMLESGVPLIVIKNFLGHVSLQSTQIYTEITQSTLNKHIKEWSEKWGPIAGGMAEEPKPASAIPEFLITKSNKSI
jgi:site-specific recombinase XerD